MEQEITRFSESFSSSIEKLYRAGGLMLVFVFISVILMAFGFLYSSVALSPWIFGIGALANLSCLGLFLYIQLKGPMQAVQLLKENKELLDSIQDISIGLIETVSKFQSLMFKHSEQIVRIIDLSAPVLAQLPMFSELTVEETRNVSAWIVNTTEKSQEVIHDIKQSLITANATNLRKYAEDLEKITQSLKDVLAKQEEMIAKIPDYKGQIRELQGRLLSVTQTMTALQNTALYYADNADKLLNLVDTLPPWPFLETVLTRVNVPQLRRLSSEMKIILIQSAETMDALKTSLEKSDTQEILVNLEQLKLIGTALEKSLRDVQISG